MAQEIIPPGTAMPAPASRPTEDRILNESVEDLKRRINLPTRIRAAFRSGRDAANVLVEMRKDVAEAQRDVVRHHATLIAKARKIDLTDRFQAATADLTRRVEQRTADETRHYWDQLAKRLDYYEEFFESRIREIQKRVDAGEMSPSRGEVRIKQYEDSRDQQQQQDSALINDIIDSNVRIVRRALEDFQPT
jgi:hypothetical protein